MNRTHKNDQDAAEWLPDLNQCWFADRVVAVRRKFGLTIDPREAAALDRVLVGWRWCADSARWASSGRHVDHRDRRRVMISM